MQGHDCLLIGEDIKMIGKTQTTDASNAPRNLGRWLTDLETNPTDPGLYSLHWIILSIVPAVSPILKAPAWIPPTVAGPRTTCILCQ